MDYTNEASYSSFLISEMFQQIDIETAIREAAILAEGVDVEARLNVLTESVFDKIKEVWDKFVAFIKRVWNKFTEAMMGVFDVDKPYLEKYRDIILKKPMESGAEVSIRNYQIDLIIKSALEPFDYNVMKNDLPDKSKLTHRFIDEFKEDQSTEDLIGWCKAYFCGGQEERVDVPGDKINLSTFYDYCYTWKDKMLPVLKKDMTAIENSTSKAMNLLNNAQKNVPKAEKPEEGGTQTQQTSTQAPVADQPAADPNAREANGSGNLFGDADTSRYSHLYEAEIKTNSSSSGGTVTSTKGTTVGSDQTAAAAVKSTAVDASKTSIDGAEDLKLLETCINNYSSVARNIATSKFTVAEWAYKEYMEVIRAHVKQQIGSKEDNPDQTVKQGQTYTGRDGTNEDGKKPATVPQAAT